MTAEIPTMMPSMVRNERRMFRRRARMRDFEDSDHGSGKLNCFLFRVEAREFVGGQKAIA